MSGVGQIVLAGDPDFDLPDRGTYFPDYNNFQPRVGVSWDIRGDGTLSVRGGAGVFHNQLKNNTTLQQLLSYPFYYQPVIRDTTLADPLLGLEREDYATAPLNPGPGYEGQPIGQLYVTDPNIITPYTTAWSISLQWEVLKSTVLETAYVGNRGEKLLQFEEINQPYNQLEGITQSNKDLYRRYPGFTSVLQTTNWGRSTYNGWETSLFRRFSDGLSFGVGLHLVQVEGPVVPLPFRRDQSDLGHDASGRRRPGGRMGGLVLRRATSGRGERDLADSRRSGQEVLERRGIEPHPRRLGGDEHLDLPERTSILALRQRRPLYHGGQLDSRLPPQPDWRSQRRSANGAGVVQHRRLPANGAERVRNVSTKPDPRTASFQRGPLVLEAHTAPG